jgi:hypothetical protein
VEKLVPDIVVINEPLKIDPVINSPLHAPI